MSLRKKADSISRCKPTHDPHIDETEHVPSIDVTGLDPPGGKSFRFLPVCSTEQTKRIRLSLKSTLHAGMLKDATNTQKDSLRRDSNPEPSDPGSSPKSLTH
jgi:hypothetical protein